MSFTSFLVCLRSLSYPARNSYSPYCHLWPARCTTRVQVISQTPDLPMKVTKHKLRVLISLQRLSETFLGLKTTGRDIIRNLYWSCVRFQRNSEFFRQVFEKYANIKFHENTSMGAEMLHPDGQADMTKLTANTPNN
jgi:hypothetical protein